MYTRDDIYKKVFNNEQVDDLSNELIDITIKQTEEMIKEGIDDFNYLIDTLMRFNLLKETIMKKLNLLISFYEKNITNNSPSLSIQSIKYMMEKIKILENEIEKIKKHMIQEMNKI
jgi:hypothetical protein